MVRQTFTMLKNRIKYFPGLSLLIDGVDSTLNRTFFDKQVRSHLHIFLAERKTLPSLAAVYRVKNGENTIAASILSVAHLCNEIIVVDNGSIDQTVAIVESLQKKLCGITNIKLFHYNQKLALAGNDYVSDKLIKDYASLADFYNYAFSLSQCQYLMKVDAHYIFTQAGLQRIRAKMRKNPRQIIFRGVEIYGKKLSYEAYAFKNQNFSFVDGPNYEKLEFSYKVGLLEKLRSTLYVPIFIHVKRLNYILAIDSDEVLRKLYE